MCPVNNPFRNDIHAVPTDTSITLPANICVTLKRLLVHTIRLYQHLDVLCRLALFLMACTEVVYKTQSCRDKITAHLSARCDAMLMLSSLPNVQIIAPAQKASLPYVVICLTPKRYCRAPRPLA